MNKMKISGKKLAVALAIITVMQMFFLLQARGIYLAVNLITIVLYGIMAYAMYRERNDTFTMIVVIVYAVVQFNIPVAILLGLAICIRYNKMAEMATKMWFVPSAVFVVLRINTFVDAFKYGRGISFVLPVLTVLLPAMLYLILGYWLIRSLGIISVKSRKKQAEKEREIEYYEQLYRDGVLTKEEFVAKKQSIE